MAPGVELIAWGSTPLPPTRRRKDGRYQGAYEWVRYYNEYADNIGTDEHPVLDFTQDYYMQPGGNMPLLPLPDWLTEYAYTPHRPLMSSADYRRETASTYR